MIWSRTKFIAITAGLFLTIFLVGCSMRLTMNGSSIPEDLNTVSVQYFVNRAPLINPNLSQTFTEAFKDRIIKESRLKLVTTTGDCDFSGEITGYDLRAMAIQADAISAETRLTITIRIRYKNYKNPKQNWEQSFARYQNFPAEKSITNVENELVDLIVTQITQDAFNKAFSEW